MQDHNNRGIIYAYLHGSLGVIGGRNLFLEAIAELNHAGLGDVGSVKKVQQCEEGQ